MNHAQSPYGASPPQPNGPQSSSGAQPPSGGHQPSWGGHQPPSGTYPPPPGAPQPPPGPPPAGGAPGSRRPKSPYDLPVRPAVALVVVTLAAVLFSVVSALGALFALGSLEVDPTGEGMIAAYLVLTLVIVAVALLTIGLSLAAFVLAIVVVVKGEGRLRVGAALVLAASVLGLVVSFSVSGDPSGLPDGVGAFATVLSVLDSVVQIARLVMMVAGVVVLILGIRETRQARAALPRHAPPR